MHVCHGAGGWHLAETGTLFRLGALRTNCHKQGVYDFFFFFFTFFRARFNQVSEMSVKHYFIFLCSCYYFTFIVPLAARFPLKGPTWSLGPSGPALLVLITRCRPVAVSQFLYSISVVEIGSHSAAQAGCKLLVLLPWLLKCRYHRCGRSPTSKSHIFKHIFCVKWSSI